jgi:glycosyltransferase involved in cell wall biosynthesis
MCAADVFVLSSDYEGMPNVVLEAMAAGVPCVCTQVNGVSGLIEPGRNGFITDHRADALAEKIGLLARDRMMRQKMGTKAIERVSSSFDPQMIAACLWRLCE